MHRVADYISDRLGGVLACVRPRKSPNASSGHSKSHQRQLESPSSSLGSIVLPNHTNFSGATGKGALGYGETAAVRGFSKASEPAARYEPVVMPTTLLEPNTHLKIKYRVPRSRVIKYYVEAERPVNTHVLDEEGLKYYYDARDFSSYGGLNRRREHVQELRLPFLGWWFLIIENPSSKESIAVHYDVSG